MFREIMTFDRRFLQTTRNDSGALQLLAANLLVVVFTILESWELGFALVVYWWQNVIIGFFSVLQMLQISDDSLKIKVKGRVEQASPFAAKAILAGFFCVHYGFFHFGYFQFLRGYFHKVDALLVFISVSVFFAQQLYGYLSAKGRGRIEDIGKFFIFPYFRIVPMHIIIIFGMMIMLVMSAIWGSRTGAGIGEKIVLLLFVFLKIKADLHMQQMENDPKWKPRTPLMRNVAGTFAERSAT